MSWLRTTPLGASRCLHVLFIFQGPSGSHSWVKERLSRSGRGAEEWNGKGKLGSRNKAAVCWAFLLLGRVFSDHGIPGLDRVRSPQSCCSRSHFCHGLHEGPTKETHFFPEAHTFNPSVQEAEAGRSLTDFQDSQCYTENPCLKEKRKGKGRRSLHHDLL